MITVDTLFHEIINVVCTHYDVTDEQLRSRITKRVIAEPRHLTVYFIYYNVKSITQQNIADYFNRDHSTIIYAIRCVNDLKDTSKSFRSQFEFLEREVKALTN